MFARIASWRIKRAKSSLISFSDIVIFLCITVPCNSVARSSLPWVDSNHRPHSPQKLVLNRLFYWDDLLLSNALPTELHDIKSRNRYRSRPYINNYQCICFDFSLTAIYPSIYIRHTCHCPIVTKHCCSAWGAFTALPARPVTLHSTAYQSPQLSHALPLVRLCIV